MEKRSEYIEIDRLPTIAWDDLPLGRVADCRLARELCCDQALVRREREQRGIPTFRSRVRAIDWSTQSWGEKTAAEIASSLGISRSAASAKRRELGVPAKAVITTPKGVDWDTQPLGKVPDVELCERFGVSASSVAHQRKIRGIPRFPQTKRARRGSDVDCDLLPDIDWGVQPLGEVTDNELADHLGVKREVVRYHRSTRGIPPIHVGQGTRRDVDWDAQPLGDVPDSEIASRLGVAPTTVKRARNRMGISARWLQHIDWDAQPLGEIPDLQLARRLGVRQSGVQHQRVKRGISRYGVSVASDEWRSQDWSRSDDDIASDLKVSTSRVARVRRSLGVYRKRGPRSGGA